MINQADTDIPVFDTTEIHVRAALEFALASEPAAFPNKYMLNNEFSLTDSSDSFTVKG